MGNVFKTIFNNKKAKITTYLYSVGLHWCLQIKVQSKCAYCVCKRSPGTPLSLSSTKIVMIWSIYSAKTMLHAYCKFILYISWQKYTKDLFAISYVPFQIILRGKKKLTLAVTCMLSGSISTRSIPISWTAPPISGSVSLIICSMTRLISKSS